MPSRLGVHVGLAVFTLDDIDLTGIRKSVPLFAYPGCQIAPSSMSDNLSASDYVFSATYKNHSITIDGSAKSGWGCYLNDAFDPFRNNCSPRLVGKRTKRISIEANCSIQANTELCMAYGKGYWLVRLHILPYEDLVKCVHFYNISEEEFRLALGWVLLYNKNVFLLLTPSTVTGTTQTVVTRTQDVHPGLYDTATPSSRVRFSGARDTSPSERARLRSDCPWVSDEGTMDLTDLVDPSPVPSVGPPPTLLRPFAPLTQDLTSSPRPFGLLYPVG